MTILQNIRANPGTAQILLGELARSGGRGNKTEILERIAPTGAGDYTPGASGDARDETVSVCVSFGLLKVEGHDLSLNVSESEWENLSDLSHFRRLVRRCLWTSVELDEDLSSGTGRFAGALAWFLCQDPLTPVMGFEQSDSGVFQLQQEQLRHDDHFFGTDRPWGAFLRWATFLGFAEELRTTPRDRLLIPDPTVALGEALVDVEFGPASSAIKSIARTLPVLDGGTIRHAVETRWRTGEPPQLVSPSLSIALCRLEREGRMSFPPAPDARPADRVVLHLGSEVRTIAVVLEGE